MRFSYLILPFFFLASSCVGASTPNDRYQSLMEPIKKLKLSETKPYVIDGETEPDFPDEKENNSTIAGVDSNHDGIRDDIEIYINRNSKTRNARMALRQLAKYSQKAIVEVEAATSEQALKTAINADRSSDCYMFVRDKDDRSALHLMSNIGDLFYGNKRRDQLQAVLSRKLFGKAVGSGISLGQGFKGCEFKIDNFDEIQKERLKE